MFDEVCSVYKDKFDAVGEYVDRETGEIITEMTIRDFCLTDRWKPYVEELRAMVAEYGAAKAKKMDRYNQVKSMIPGATPSGLFELRPDVCVNKRTGEQYMKPVRRRDTHLVKHTGWLVLDIDLQDNVHLENFENVRMAMQFRPEVALCMRSCSGTGYFALARLAYPDKHKSQFAALIEEYRNIGITLDKQCGNIGRVRFASWDDPEHIYIRQLPVLPYKGLQVEQGSVIAPVSATLAARPQQGTLDNPDFLAFKADCIVSALERMGGSGDLTTTYDEWVKIGWSLKGIVGGERLYHRLSSLNAQYNAAETQKKWAQLGESRTVSINYLFSAARRLMGDAAYSETVKRAARDYHHR